jgi:putative glutamine amidotransferase
MIKSPLIGITPDIEGKYLRLRRDYGEAVDKAGGMPVFLPPLLNAVSYAEMIDALLIPGGRDINPSYYHEEILPQVKPVLQERSDFEISLLMAVIKLSKPVLGICYGMQLINVAFGGTLYQDINSQLLSDIDHRKGYHTIAIQEGRFLIKGDFSVNSTHHQAIKKLGTGLAGFAFSSDNLVEAFYARGYPFLVGVQWHPERLPEDSLSSELFRLFIEAARGKAAKS